MNASEQTRPIVEVAVGIIIDEQKKILLAKRPEGKPYAHYWEFPGGKVEQDETVLDALTRELSEELGIQVTRARFWQTIEHDYPHAYVRLHLHMVRQWAGQATGLEGQELYWQQLKESQLADVEPLLPATVSIIELLKLAGI